MKIINFLDLKISSNQICVCLWSCVCISDQESSVMHNLIWVSSMVSKFRNTNDIIPRKSSDRQNYRQKGGRTDRTYFIGPFQLLQEVKKLFLILLFSLLFIHCIDHNITYIFDIIMLYDAIWQIHIRYIYIYIYIYKYIYTHIFISISISLSIYLSIYLST